MIRVAIADDSKFTCRLLASHLESSGQCQVVGMAHDAASTVALARAAQPDVLTLDLEMPGVQGLDLLQQLMTECPLRIVVISGVSKRAAAVTLRALDLGAVEFVLKYTSGVPSSPQAIRREIVAKVIAAASAALGRSTPIGPTPRPATPPTPPAGRATGRGARKLARRSCAGVVVIGASTGGPTAVREVLAELPAGFPFAVLIVQHLPAALTTHFAELLEANLTFSVAEATTATRLEAGQALVAPGGTHTFVTSAGAIEVRRASDDDVYRPSIDVAMRSAAETFGRDATGVVLTGMGRDGADGLRTIRARGGIAYVQALDTCVIAGMPQRALEAAGADYILSPTEIGRALAWRGRAA